MVLGVWVNIKQNPGARQRVNSRPEALCLFILASLGDRTDKACYLRVNRHLSLANYLPSGQLPPAVV